MSKIELIMPKMGESVAEATIIKWVKEIGDSISMDETVVEIATDKVDSEIPSIAEGILIEKRYQENDVVKVGEVIAIIENNKNTNQSTEKSLKENYENISAPKNTPNDSIINKSSNKIIPQNSSSQENKNNFLSPLVKSIAKKENISEDDLNMITGTGKNNRITKSDILNFIKNKSNQEQNLERQNNSLNINQEENIQNIKSKQTISKEFQGQISSVHITNSDDTEIVEMDRMRKIIANHMISSKSISAHVTSFVEADVTKIVEWRSRIKKRFEDREGQKITFTPIIFESIIKAIVDFPMINISVSGENIIKHKKIHLGMATALKNGNLIVPVIRNAQEKNILGLTKEVNDLAKRARLNKLNPDEIAGGTFTVTNVGSFGSIMGTPIINQPQVAILALGKIQKKASVIESPLGDMIGIRSKMFLSLSYDHRVVDGALGGQFLKKVADYLENFDNLREI
ncbi:MAG: diapophytoene dehydrogenase [Flavobacteriales bacterium]|nr:diapophytoene dehydrogenase [Flavobacteriales bacterium]|tara:strand:+ start:33294 stop:34667 length:1374 start_codon:yes stop_codon:yes gene_type:complete